MPISVTNTGTGGPLYGPITVGPQGLTHQVKVDVSELEAAVDDDGYLPVGLPIDAHTGAPVVAADPDAEPDPIVGTQMIAVIGPEAVKMGSADHFANAIFNGGLNQDAIEDNIGRALSATELALFAASNFTLF